MLHVLLVTCAALIFALVLAVPHAAKAHHRARLFLGRSKSGPR